MLRAFFFETKHIAKFSAKWLKGFNRNENESEDIKIHKGKAENRTLGWGIHCMIKRERFICVQKSFGRNFSSLFPKKFHDQITSEPE
jgi:hypothetical protein